MAVENTLHETYNFILNSIIFCFFRFLSHFLMTNQQDPRNGNPDAMLRSFIALLEAATYREHRRGPLGDAPATVQDPRLLNPALWRDVPLRPVCTQCPAFNCVKRWRSVADIPLGADAECWMQNHGFLSPPSCPKHGVAHMVDVPGKSHIQICNHRESGSRNACTENYCMQGLNPSPAKDSVSVAHFWRQKPPFASKAQL